MDIRAPSAEQEAAFYEGRWAEADASDASPRNYLVKKERFFVRRLKGVHGRVLDVGCGGGWRFLSRIGPVAGVDLSQRSLQSAAQVYGGLARAGLCALPFADESFDLAVSRDLLGHIPLEHKDQALRELRRVLAPGGLTLHYVETSADDPLSRFARRYPELYERYVVAPEGHVGVEPAAALFARFRAAGFVPLAEIAAYKGFIYVDRVLQYFDNEYCERSWPLRLLVAACRPLARVRPLAAAANLAVTLLVEAADHVLPSAWAGGALVFYAKGS